MIDQAAAMSFGGAAAAYDRFRPPYPPQAAAWLAGHPAPARVVDLGAGTGILTRALLRLGYHVVPVEPDAEMRTQLALATPGTTALPGAAEAIPVADGTVDAIVAGQAYHWFDRERAHAEAARAIRTGGTFGTIWNSRDETVPWVAALTAIFDRLERDAPLGREAPAAQDTPLERNRPAQRNRPTEQDTPAERGIRDDAPTIHSFGDRFGPVERAEFRHCTTHTAESLVGMITTRSYYLTATPQRRRQVEQAVRDLATSHPDLAGRETFELPYRTTCFRARRR